MTLKACIMTLACLFAAAVQAQQALPDSTAPVALEPMKIEAETLKRLPVRGVQAVVGLMPGVVTLNGNLHMRGGRADEIGYTVNGMNVNRPMDGLFSLPLIHNAIEAISVYSSGYSAGQSGRLSGLVEITTKTGGDRLKLTGEIISDDFWKVKGDDGGLRVLGLDDTYSYGYNDYTLTLGGPVPGVKGLRFFTAGEIWNEASEATRFQGFQQDSLYAVRRYRDGQMRTDTVSWGYYADLPPGRLPGGGRNGFKVNGRITFVRPRFQLDAGCNFSFSRQRQSSANPTQFVAVSSRPYNEEWRQWQGFVQGHHKPVKGLEHTVSLGFWNRFYEGSDNVLGDDVLNYGNPEMNAALTEVSVLQYKENIYDDVWAYRAPGSPAVIYSKNKENRLQVKWEGAWDITDQHRLIWGVDYEKETIRRYSVNALGLYERYLRAEANPDMMTLFDVYRPLDLVMIGYDWQGREVDKNTSATTRFHGPRDEVGDEFIINLHNRPMTPQSFSCYLEEQYTGERIALYTGLRYVALRNGCDNFKDYTLFHEDKGRLISEDDFDDEVQSEYWLPRIQLTFQLNETWHVSAHYGEYIQKPNAWDTWARMGFLTFSYRLFDGIWQQLAPNPGLEAERSTQYQLGLHKSAGANTFSVELFEKRQNERWGMKDVMPQIGARHSTPVSLFNSYDDFVQGATVSYASRWNSACSFRLYYTLQRSREKGDMLHPYWGDIGWWNWPETPVQNMITTERDIRHSIRADIATQSDKSFGPVIGGIHPLGRMNLNAVFQARSGRPYTKINVDDALSEVYGYNSPKPLAALNSSTAPWFWQLDVRLGKTVDVGPVRVEAYILALNLFDTKSVTDVFRQTGSNTSDGWLGTAEGKKKIADKGEEWVKWYNADLTGCGTFGWQPPRQLRAGLRFEL